jgi:hypothetical protein
MNKKLLLEKYIKVAVKKALKEQEAAQKRAEKSMYLVYRFPGLKKTMTELMSPAFGRYVSNISIVAPKPTTFSINLINGQDFTIYYLGKGKFMAKIAGKKYYPANLGELERGSQAIADLLELNYGTAGEEKEPSSAAAPAPSSGGGSEAPTPEETSRDQELAADLAAATGGTEAPAEEEAPEEEIPAEA